eukprot:6105540-Pyramimonas_sp.AAC.1
MNVGYRRILRGTWRNMPRKIFQIPRRSEEGWVDYTSRNGRLGCDTDEQDIEIRLQRRLLHAGKIAHCTP